MGYAELYEFAKALTPKVGRNLVKSKVLEIAEVDKVHVMATSLDTSSCRGFYVSPRNTEHRLVQRYGCHVIVFARGMAKDLERFVIVKEMMHLFDDPLESTDDPRDFESTLNDLTVASPSNMSLQLRSEHAAVWMALGILCPEPHRISFKRERSLGLIDDKTIAETLDIPIVYIPHLLGEGFDVIMNAILRSDFGKAA